MPQKITQQRLAHHLGNAAGNAVSKMALLKVKASCG